eukprot:scaffold259375_cov60-Cyclotella_meneghiniana.AAC.1
MSHYEYNKWQDKVEIGLHCPQWCWQLSSILDWNALPARVSTGWVLSSSRGKSLVEAPTQQG